MTVQKPLQDSVSETLLIPLYFRHRENLRAKSGKKPILVDELASELVVQIPYDYAKFDSSRFSRVGCVARARYFDEKVIEFISKNENAVVILGGCGLDTRYNRILQYHKENEIPHFNCAKFYEIDLPEVITLRKKLLKESLQDSFIATSLLDNTWAQELKIHTKNARFIAVVEGVVMYFDGEQVGVMFENLATFGECELWFDVLGSLFAKKKIKHDTLKKMDVRIKSYADNEKDIIAFGKGRAKVQMMESAFYPRKIGLRCGIFGLLMSLLPAKLLGKMGFMCGVKITKK